MNWHMEHQESLSPGARIADWIIKWVGSTASIFLHTAVFLFWFDKHWDISLLTNIVSLEAIYLSIYILISTNIHSERDRHQAEADYETNRAAKEEIECLQEHLHRIEDKKLSRLQKDVNSLLALHKKK